MSFPFTKHVHINRTDYDKAHFYPTVLKNVYKYGTNLIARRLCHGFEQRLAAHVVPSKWTLHTTGGKKGSSMRGELLFLLNSPLVSCNYFLGKGGELFRLLNPKVYVHWTNGLTIPGHSNYQTLSIEAHVTKGELWTDPMRVSLAQLILEGSYAYNIDLSNVNNVDLHRRIQHPSRIGTVNEKFDPHGWDNDEFDEWRFHLCKVLWPKYQRFMRS